MPGARGSWWLVALFFSLVAIPLWIAHFRTFIWVPKPKDAEPSEFSERRALPHIQDLVLGIGDRQVRTNTTNKSLIDSLSLYCPAGGLAPSCIGMLTQEVKVRTQGTDLHRMCMTFHPA